MARRAYSQHAKRHAENSTVHSSSDCTACRLDLSYFLFGVCDGMQTQVFPSSFCGRIVLTRALVQLRATRFRFHENGIV